MLYGIADISRLLPVFYQNRIDRPSSRSTCHHRSRQVACAHLGIRWSGQAYLRVLRSSASDIHRAPAVLPYPQQRLVRAARAMARHYKVQLFDVLFGLGASETLSALCLFTGYRMVLACITNQFSNHNA